MPYDISKAFLAWFRNRFEGDPEGGSLYLFQCAQDDSSDNVVWPLLKLTGDVEYNQATFLKASEMILKDEILNEEKLNEDD